MNLQPQLYIDTSGNPLGEPTFERVDFFDFESIELNSSFQDIRDISKVFTDYSKTFSVPASPKNNKIFRHYYNSNIEDGFDARIKQKAEIYLNGVLFKVGYVRLTKATYKSSRPHSYRITFFGALTKIQNVIGVSELSELSTLDKYNHTYNIDNVNNGFRTGLELSSTGMITGAGKDIVYPSISASEKWFYDSNASTDSSATEFNQGFSTNIYDSSNDGSYGINWLNLKPAIKVKHIISAIEDKYSSIDFSDDFFGTAEFDDLYMLLHSNKGALAPKSSTNADTSVTYRIGSSNIDSDFSLDSGYEERRPMLTYWENTGINQVRVFQYHVIVDVSSVIKPNGGSNPIYTIEILDGNTTIDKLEGVNSDTQITSVLCSENRKEWDNISVRVSSRENELATFELNVELKRLRFKVADVGIEEYICDVQNFINDGGTPVTESSLYSTRIAGTQSLVQNIEITKNMPKMKIIDFLTGIFKTFNLTAIVGNDGQIQVKPLIDFYNTGNTIDITNMVDNSEMEVNRMDLFKNISFEFSEPKTFGIINNNELSQTDYGNLEYESVANGTDASLIFDGKDYKVKLPFEKMYYERLFDEDTGKKTSFGNGWLVDKDQNEVMTKPILFFNVVQPVDSSKFRIGFLGKPLVTQYNRASNSNASEYWTGSSWYVEQGTKSINFNGEFDEFSFTLIARGLFRKYYSDYISSVFDKKTRVFKLKMKASISFLLRYKINDTLLMNGEKFLINNIRTNLNTGVTDLELILKFFSSEDADPVGDPVTTPTGLYLLPSLNNDELSISWLANPSGEIVKGYKIYVDGVLNQTLLRQTSYIIQGLIPNTSYDVQVSAYDAQGNESSLTSVLTATTGSSDTEAPTTPSNLVITGYSSTSVGLSWNASTDNVAVTGYEVYVDGVLNQTVTGTSANILGLTSNTVYEFYVRAKDVVPNYSDISNSVLIRTL
jgi:chitodextrinase